MTLVPKCPRIRLISPLQRRIATVHPSSATSEQLHRLGWRLYTGPAKVATHHAGSGRREAAMRPDADPRNGFIIPGTDPDLEPSTRAGSIDFNPYGADIT